MLQHTSRRRVGHVAAKRSVQVRRFREILVYFHIFNFYLGKDFCTRTFFFEQLNSNFRKFNLSNWNLKCKRSRRCRDTSVSFSRALDERLSIVIDHGNDTQQTFCTHECLSGRVCSRLGRFERGIVSAGRTHLDYSIK